MNTVIRKSMVFLLFVFVAATHAEPKTDKPFVYVGYVNNPPFIIPVRDGRPTGIFSDIMLLILEKNEIDYDLIYYPINRYYRMLIQGQKSQIGFLPRHTPEISRFVWYDEQPMAKIKLRIYSLKTVAKNWVKQRKKRIITILGYKYNNFLAQLDAEHGAITQIKAPNNYSALKMLSAGRGDYILSYDSLISFASKRVDAPKLFYSDIKTVDYHLVIHKNVPGGRVMLQKLAQTLRQLELDGTIDAIYRRYLN